MSGTQPITLILQEFANGDKTALNRLMPLVYAELRKLADGYLRNERSAHTSSTHSAETQPRSPGGLVVAGHYYGIAGAHGGCVLGTDTHRSRTRFSSDTLNGLEI